MLYFIVNLTSRTGKSNLIWKEIREYLNQNNIEYKAFKTKYKGHASELASKLCKLNEEKVDVIIVGGDGTINEVINGITDFDKIRIGVIPAGSGNDFANGVGITHDIKSNMTNIMECVNKGVYKKNDLGKVIWDDNQSRYFCISSGVGMDAIVCKKALDSKIKTALNKIKMGKLTYLVLTLQTLFSMKKFNAKVSVNDKQYKDMIFAAAMNLPSEGGGVRMSPSAIKDDAKLNLCIAHDLSKIKAFGALGFLVLAKHEKLACFDSCAFEECEMTFEEPVVLHADGEYCGDVTKVKFECEGELLKLLY